MGIGIETTHQQSMHSVIELPYQKMEMCETHQTTEVSYRHCKQREDVEVLNNRLCTRTTIDRHAFGMQ